MVGHQEARWDVERQRQRRYQGHERPDDRGDGMSMTAVDNRRLSSAVSWWTSWLFSSVLSGLSSYLLSLRIQSWLVTGTLCSGRTFFKKKNIPFQSSLYKRPRARYVDTPCTGLLSLHLLHLGHNFPFFFFSFA